MPKSLQSTQMGMTAEGRTLAAGGDIGDCCCKVRRARQKDFVRRPAEGIVEDVQARGNPLLDPLTARVRRRSTEED